MTRGEQVSELTMPKIFPKDGNGDAKLNEPEQSLGSIGTSTLASKLMLILFPPTGSTKYSVDQLTVAKRNEVLELTQNIIAGIDADAEMKQKEIGKIENEKNTNAELKAALRLLEQKQDSLLNNSGLINKIGYGLLHFIITGNFAFFLDKDLTSRLYSLRNYVVDRDRNGEVIEVIARDYRSFASMTEEQQGLVAADSDKEPDEMKEVAMYLQSKKISKGKWEIKEYAEDVLLSEWTLKNNPIIAPFTDQVSGNVYNYGLGNEILGDLKAYEQLTKNTKQISAAASKIVFLVKQGSGMVIRDLNKASNLDFVYGDADKISTLQIDKLNDLAIVNNEKEEIKKRISTFFMLNSAAQRDSERTTKYELQKVISDIDAAFGNLYSTLAREIQLPVAQLMLEYMTTEGELSGIIPDGIEINIVTAKQSLADETQLQSIDYLVQTANNLGVPEILNAEAILTELCTTTNLSSSDMILPNEKVKAVLMEKQQMMLELEQMKMQMQMQMQTMMQQMQQQAQTPQQAQPEQTPAQTENQTTGDV
jgi:hypothetical protein